ncbi:MAG TPA: type IV-A pilus assembly ATPase PilB [Rhodanobacteraceae bacterium]
MQSPALAGLTGMARRLVDEGILAEVDARQAMHDAADKRVPLTRWCVEQGMVDSTRMAAVASAEFGMPLIDASAVSMQQMPLDSVSEALITKHQVLPLFKRGNRLYVGVDDPTRTHALDEVKFHAGCLIEPVLVETQQLKRTIDQALASMATTVDGMEGDESLDNLDLSSEIDHQDDARAGVDANKIDDTPVVKFVNKVLLDAIKRGASDIHFEPFETQYRVRVRMDGILHIMAKAPILLASRISSRLKVMSGLDIAEKRVPQDGRIKLNLTKTKSIDFRVSTLPTLAGEKIVLRILDASAAKMGIDKLGYEEDQKQLYLNAIKKPYGMVLVTGPTGSGKTVSLYTALNILNVEGTNISTVEDPVEIRVDGINQVQQNVKRGMTFARALRSFLRQDPDVIMVGEIRDLETAEIAIKAAQTGHMVLSTLHTNDAPQTISRLMNMGIAPYNITSSVSLVIAQRLVRRLHDCKRPLKLPPEALLAEGFTQEEVDAGITIYEPVGCDGCTEGYKGRVGIYQVMPMLEDIQRVILEGGNAMRIADVAHAAGIPDLHQSALKKVRDGVTSLTEINRVTKD